MRNLALMWVWGVCLLAVAVEATWRWSVPEPSPTEQPWKSGETTVALSQDGTLTVSGEGAMEDYALGQHNRTPWMNAIGHGVAPSIISVVIEDGVTHIGDFAFMGFSPKSITVAADNTHYSSEDGILFNKNKTILILYPIDRKQDIYTIPNGVTKIGMMAFSGCWNLSSITIPNSVTTIGTGAFSGCMNLASITIPNSVTTIEERAFEFCDSLTSITIPNSVIYIGNRAFYQSNLTSITIPGSIKTIGAGAFGDCRGLTFLTIENGVMVIGEDAFSDCHNLTSVTIPQSVMYIGNHAFVSCTNLSSVISLNPHPPKFGSEVFANCVLNLAYVPARSYFAYRAADGWNEFEHVKIFVTSYEIIALGILSALLLSVAVFAIFIIIKKSRIKQGEERRK